MPELYSITPEEKMVASLTPLYSAFTGHRQTPEVDDLLKLAQTHLEFRAGRPREETPWETGEPLSTDQRVATLEVAHGWSMLETTSPTADYDEIVILGAHSESLTPRTRYAVELLKSSAALTGLMVLSCQRPIHPKENVDLDGVKTELDLAVNLLEDESGEDFRLERLEPIDLSDSVRRQEGEEAVAYVGTLGVRKTMVLSGSLPIGASRATTLSTLTDLRHYLKHQDKSLLFVTTSLHMPYQKLQIAQTMRGVPHEVIGALHPVVEGADIDSPDAVVRMVLQEIGATIKNRFSYPFRLRGQDTHPVPVRLEWLAIASKLIDVAEGKIGVEDLSSQERDILTDEGRVSYSMIQSMVGENYADRVCEILNIPQD